MMMMMMMMKGFCSFLFVRFSFNATNNLFLSCSAAFFFSRSIQCYSNDFISIWRRPSPARMPTNLFFVSRQLPHPLSLSHSRLYPSLFFFLRLPFLLWPFLWKFGGFQLITGKFENVREISSSAVIGPDFHRWLKSGSTLFVHVYIPFSLSISERLFWGWRWISLKNPKENSHR